MECSGDARRAKNVVNLDKKQVNLYASGKLSAFTSGLKVCESLPVFPICALYPFLFDFRDFGSLPLKSLKNLIPATDATSHLVAP